MIISFIFPIVPHSLPTTFLRSPFLEVILLRFCKNPLSFLLRLISFYHYFHIPILSYLLSDHENRYFRNFFIFILLKLVTSLMYEYLTCNVYENTHAYCPSLGLHSPWQWTKTIVARFFICPIQLLIVHRLI